MCSAGGRKDCQEQPRQPGEGLREEPCLGLHRAEQADSEGAGGKGQQGTMTSKVPLTQAPCSLLLVALVRQGLKVLLVETLSDLLRPFLVPTL